MNYDRPNVRIDSYWVLPSCAVINTIGVTPVCVQTSYLSYSPNPPFNNLYYYSFRIISDMARDTYNLVQSRYGDIAKYSLNTQQSKVEDNIARAFGYTAEDLKVLPEKANLALSCGNPVGFANLKEVWLSSLVPRRHKLSPNLLVGRNDSGPWQRQWH